MVFGRLVEVGQSYKQIFNQVNSIVIRRHLGIEIGYRSQVTQIQRHRLARNGISRGDRRGRLSNQLGHDALLTLNDDHAGDDDGFRICVGTGAEEE